MADITIEGATKVYPDGTEAVSDLNLEIGDGILSLTENVASKAEGALGRPAQAVPSPRARYDG